MDVMGADCFATVLTVRCWTCLSCPRQPREGENLLSKTSIVYAGGGDWEVVMLVQPSPDPVELREVSHRLTMYACF